MGNLKRDYGRKQAWRNNAIAQMVENLTELGQKACLYAISQKGYDNQKYNLRDSIGSAVYVDGKIVPSSKRYAFRKSSKGSYIDRGYNGTGDEETGRSALDAYWEDNKKLKNYKNTVELVVIAGTFYAGILESSDIQVISAATDYLQDKMHTYKSFKPKLRAFADDLMF